MFFILQVIVILIDDEIKHIDYIKNIQLKFR